MRTWGLSLADISKSPPELLGVCFIDVDIDEQTDWDGAFTQAVRRMLDLQFWPGREMELDIEGMPVAVGVVEAKDRHRLLTASEARRVGVVTKREYRELRKAGPS